MKTQKGYILPAVLIIILLIIAGVVTFGMKEETPIVETPSDTSPEPVFVPMMPIIESSTSSDAFTATTSNEIDIGGELIVE